MVVEAIYTHINGHFGNNVLRWYFCGCICYVYMSYCEFWHKLLCFSLVLFWNWFFLVLESNSHLYCRRDKSMVTKMHHLLMPFTLWSRMFRLLGLSCCCVELFWYIFLCCFLRFFCVIYFLYCIKITTLSAAYSSAICLEVFWSGSKKYIFFLELDN